MHAGTRAQMHAGSGSLRPSISPLCIPGPPWPPEKVVGEGRGGGLFPVGPLAYPVGNASKVCICSRGRETISPQAQRWFGLITTALVLGGKKKEERPNSKGVSEGLQTVLLSTSNCQATWPTAGVLVFIKSTPWLWLLLKLD